MAAQHSASMQAMVSTKPVIFAPPPGLERNDDCMPSTPPGKFEGGRPLPPPPAYRAPASIPPAYPAPASIAYNNNVQEAVWKACEECLRIKCVQNNWAFPGHVPANSTETAQATTDGKNTMVPLKPPGILLRNGTTDSDMMLKRVSSSESLISTAATSTGESDDGKQVAQQMQPSPSSQSEGTPQCTAADMQDSVVRDLRIERTEDGHMKIFWPVDAKKFNRKDKQIVSPSFEIQPGSSFKLILKPEAMGEKKGQACFQKAKGCGSVDLKMMCCEDSAPTLRLGISVGDNSLEGSMEHDFGNSSVCALGQQVDVFDFRSAADSNTQTTLVCLEVLS